MRKLLRSVGRKKSMQERGWWNKMKGMAHPFDDDRYIAFDVETPNSNNDRISSIGVSVVEGGRIVQKFESLVNPEVYFSQFNIQLTGIAPRMVENAPTFEALWDTLRPIFDSGLLIAHNAPFDMGVLGKCLRAYCIEWRDTVDYACTVQMGRRCYPQLPNHRLDTLCAHIGIPLDHHQAGSDSLACAQLLINYFQCGIDIASFRKRYNLQAMQTMPCAGTGSAKRRRKS